MKTQVNAQNTSVFGSWWESTDLRQKGYVKDIHGRIDQYLDKFGPMGAIENLSTMLEYYLYVQTQINVEADPKEISSLAVNTTSLIAFISSLDTYWRHLRSEGTPKMKPAEPTSSLDQAISEVWAGYLDVKQRFNVEDEDIESKLVAWRELISEWAGVTVAVIPEDYEWQKPLEDFRKEYQALTRL